MKHILWAFLLLATQAFGTTLPAAITGDYSGFKYDCRFQAGIHVVSPDHKALGMTCTLPNNRQTTALALAYGCPNEWTMLPMNEWGSSGVAKAPAILTYTNPLGEKVDVLVDIGSYNKSSTNWVRVVGYRLGVYVDVMVAPFDVLSAGGGTYYRLSMHQVIDLIPPLSYYPDCYSPPVPKPSVCRGRSCK